MAKYTLKNITREEEKELKALKSPTFYPENDIPAIDRRLTEILKLREEQWTIKELGTNIVFNMDDPSEPIKVMMVGVGGVGKSRLGSVLHGGKPVFKSSQSLKSETKKVERRDFKFEGQSIAVFDTPGYGLKDILEDKATFMDKIEAHIAIKKGLDEIGDGVHVIAFVMNAGNPRTFTDEVNIIQKSKLLDERTFDHCIIVVTHCKGMYDQKGREVLIDKMKEDDAGIKKILGRIEHRILLVELGRELETFDRTEYTYDCELQKAKKMVLAMVAKTIQSNKVAGRDIIYSTDLMREDLSKRDPKKGGCFPSAAMVYTEEGRKSIKDLHLDENILVVDNYGVLKYEPIIMFTHASPHEWSTFVSITGENDQVIRLSAHHFLHVTKLGSLKPARDVKVGNVIFAIDSTRALTTVKVKAIEFEKLSGLYGPKTPSGSIVVDGIVASCYSNTIPVMVAHGALIPVIALHRILPTAWYTWVLEHDNTHVLLAKLRSFISIWI